MSVVCRDLLARADRLPLQTSVERTVQMGFDSGQRCHQLVYFRPACDADVTPLMNLRPLAAGWLWTTETTRSLDLIRLR